MGLFLLVCPECAESLAFVRDADHWLARCLACDFSEIVERAPFVPSKVARPEGALAREHVGPEGATDLTPPRV